MILCSWVLLVLFIIILSLMGWSWCCFSSCYCFHHDPVFLSASDAVDHDPVTHWTRFWCWFLRMLLFHHDPVFPVRSWCFHHDSVTQELILMLFSTDVVIIHDPVISEWSCYYSSWSCHSLISWCNPGGYFMGNLADPAGHHGPVCYSCSYTVRISSYRFLVLLIN